MYGIDIIKYKNQTIIQVYDSDNDLVDEVRLDFIKPKTFIDNLLLFEIIKDFKEKYNVIEVNTFRLTFNL